MSNETFGRYPVLDTADGENSGEGTGPGVTVVGVELSDKRREDDDEGVCGCFIADRRPAGAGKEIWCGRSAIVDVVRSVEQVSRYADAKPSNWCCPTLLRPY